MILQTSHLLSFYTKAIDKNYRFPIREGERGISPLPNSKTGEDTRLD